ncbi:MAG: serine hydrolase [Gloeomargarita sp. DG02_5_bins_242]
MSFYQPHATLTHWGETLIPELCASHHLTPEQIGITWLVYGGGVRVNTGGALDPQTFWQQRPWGWSHRGEVNVYPASMVKLFYLVAAHEWLERGMIPPDPEIDRAMTDMIRDSSNDATSYIVDVLTGTTSGPDLAPGPFSTWQYQRNLINRYFQSWQWPEFSGINLNQKTWCEGPYGRERAFVGPNRENRNRLNPLATARLFHAILGGIAVSPRRSQQMLDVCRRSLHPADWQNNPDNQIQGFLGEGLPAEAKFWSKAGHTSEVRHDCAYVEWGDDQACLLVVFTVGEAQSRNEKLLPELSRWVYEQLSQAPLSYSNLT